MTGLDKVCSLFFYFLFSPLLSSPVFVFFSFIITDGRYRRLQASPSPSSSMIPSQTATCRTSTRLTTTPISPWRTTKGHSIRTRSWALTTSRRRTTSLLMMTSSVAVSGAVTRDRAIGCCDVIPRWIRNVGVVL